MDPAALFADKRLTAKQRSSELARLLLDGRLAVGTLVEFARTVKAPLLSTCLEGLELATRTTPALATEAVLELAVDALGNKAPAVKREAGRVIGNIAHRYPKAIGPAIAPLLANAGHDGTVVRWSAAFALGEIVKLRTPHNKQLVPQTRALAEQEEKDSIRKIQLAALKAADGAGR